MSNKDEGKTIGVVVRLMLNDPFQSSQKLYELGAKLENSYFVCFDAPKDTDISFIYQECCLYWNLNESNYIFTD